MLTPNEAVYRISEAIRHVLKPRRSLSPNHTPPEGDFPEPPAWITLAGISSVEFERYLGRGPKDIRSENGPDTTWLEWRVAEGDDPLEIMLWPLVWYVLEFAQSPEWQQRVARDRFDRENPIPEYTRQESADIELWHALRTRALKSKNPVDAQRARNTANALKETTINEFLKSAMEAELRQFEKHLSLNQS